MATGPTPTSSPSKRASQSPIGLAAELAKTIEARLLADWLELVEGEDVGVGPVATLAEAAAQLGRSPSAAGSANRSGRRSSSSG